MADQKISELTAITGANTADDDLLVIVDTSTGETKKITLGELEAGIARGDMTFGDNQKAIFGAGSDLQIYHDGSHSYIKDAGTGQLRILATDLRINNATNDKSYITGTDGAEITLYHSGSGKLATTSTGIDVTGTATMDGLTVDGDVTIRKSNPDLHITSDDTGQSDIFFGGATSPEKGRIQYSDNSDFMRLYAGNTKHIELTGNGDISFYEDTGTTAKFFWDASAESLTLDNATSTYGLDITGQGNGDRGMRVKNETDGTAARSNLRIENAGGIGANLLYPATSYTGVSGWANRLILGADGASNGITLRGAEIRLTGDDSLHNPDLVVTSAGNVGIGTSSPTEALDVAGKVQAQEFRADLGSGGKGYEFTASGSGAGVANMFCPAGYTLAFGTNGEERIRINSSGTLLVGKTSADSGASNGLQVGSNGNTYITRTSATANTNTVLALDRKSSDGEILRLRKDGTTVGSIGASSGAAYIYGAGSGLRFNASNIIVPSNSTGTNRDALTDLGASTARFKDLYLSGGVYLGGTGAANHLDDYETGTFTPTVGGTWTTSPTSLSGYYVKTGKSVFIHIQFTGGAKASSSAGWLAGLPFVMTENGTGSVVDSNVTAFGSCLLANSDRCWLTSNSFSATNYLTGTYVTS